MKSLTVLFSILLSLPIVSRAQSSQDFESSQITTNTIVASSFINDAEGWAVDNAGVLQHTTDSAKTWSSVATEKYFLKLNFTDVFNGYGITASAMYKSTDGGNSWIELAVPAINGKALYFINNSTGFVSGKEAIYKTSNSGTTWSTISTIGVSFRDFFFINELSGIAAAYDDDSSKCIWRTTDGGQTWSNVYIEENYFINSIWFTNENNGWAVGYYEQAGRGMLPIINNTSDGGLTWKNVFINRHPGDLKGEELLDIRFKNELEGFVTSTYSESLITSDGGET